MDKQEFVSEATKYFELVEREDAGDWSIDLETDLHDNNVTLRVYNADLGESIRVKDSDDITEYPEPDDLEEYLIDKKEQRKHEKFMELKKELEGEE